MKPCQNACLDDIETSFVMVSKTSWLCEIIENIVNTLRAIF